MVGWIVGGVAAACAAVCGWGVWENHALMLRAVRIEDGALPAAFTGLRIAHLSDLHNARFGRGQRKLLQMLAAAQPDLIAVTGDLIDKRRPGMANALDFARGARSIAPVFYVPGNHEASSAEYPRLKRELSACGVRVLEDDVAVWERDGAFLTIAGIADPRFCVPNQNDAIAQCMREKLARVLPDCRGYTLLLTHRPETFDLYHAAGVPLVLCGHAHGGQFRLPWGGLIAPNQGLFPKYTQGVYAKGDTRMCVSRGLGNSSIPIRLCNRPEVVLITLVSR